MLWVSSTQPLSKIQPISQHHERAALPQYFDITRVSRSRKEDHTKSMVCARGVWRNEVFVGVGAAADRGTRDMHTLGFPKALIRMALIE